MISPALNCWAETGSATTDKTAAKAIEKKRAMIFSFMVGGGTSENSRDARVHGVRVKVKLPWVLCVSTETACHVTV
jgi:hypothetical protein